MDEFDSPFDMIRELALHLFALLGLVALAAMIGFAVGIWYGERAIAERALNNKSGSDSATLQAGANDAAKRGKQ